MTADVAIIVMVTSAFGLAAIAFYRGRKIRRLERLLWEAEA